MTGSAGQTGAVRSIAAFAMGPIALAVLGFVTLPLTAWIFPPADVGRLSLFQVTVTVLALVTYLGLDQRYMREFHESSSRRQLLAECIVPTGLVLVLVSVAMMVWAEPIAQAIFGIAERTYTVLVLAGVWATALTRYLTLILRMHDRGFAFSLGQVAAKTIFLCSLIFVALIATRPDFLTLAMVLVASNVLGVGVVALLSWPEWVPRRKVSLDRTRIVQHLWFGLPLMGAAIAFWGLQSITIVTLRGLASFDEVAIYAVAMSCAAVAVVVQSIFSTIWIPMVYRWAASGQDLDRVDVVTRKVAALVCAVLSLTGVFAWAVPLVLPVYYDPIQYLLAGAVVQPLLHTLADATVVGLALERRAVSMLWVTLLALGLNAVGCLLLVPQLGAAGAIGANCFAFLAYFVLRTRASDRLWRRFDRRTPYTWTGAGVGVAVFTALMGEGRPWLVTAMWIAVLIGSASAFRKEWRSMLGGLRALPSGLRR